MSKSGNSGRQRQFAQSWCSEANALIGMGFLFGVIRWQVEDYIFGHMTNCRDLNIWIIAEFDEALSA